MAARARLYVRSNVPLAQAKEAMLAKSSPAAVVVDDNFSPRVSKHGVYHVCRSLAQEPPS